MSARLLSAKRIRLFFSHKLVQVAKFIRGDELRALRKLKRDCTKFTVCVHEQTRRTIGSRAVRDHDHGRFQLQHPRQIRAPCAACDRRRRPRRLPTCACATDRLPVLVLRCEAITNENNFLQAILHDPVKPDRLLGCR